MMYSEFVELAGYEPTYEDYVSKIEPLYLQMDCDKKEFCECYKKTRKYEKKRPVYMAYRSRDDSVDVFEECGQDKKTGKMCIYKYNVPYKDYVKKYETVGTLYDLLEKNDYNVIISN